MSRLKKVRRRQVKKCLRRGVKVLRRWCRKKSQGKTLPETIEK